MLLVIGLALIITVVFVYFSVDQKLGGRNEGSRLQFLQESANFKEKQFLNLVPTPMVAPSFSTMRKFFSNKGNKVPKQALKTKSFDQVRFSEIGNQSISFAWFGHSSVLLRISNTTLLIDPVFGERASLFSLMGPQRFPYTNVHKVEDLPPVDIVLISHDYYDHLEYETIRALKDRVKHFYVPLGVRVHLERWGVNSEKIVELDWWNETVYDDHIGFAFTPTRHFSGRGLSNRNQTLWGSWSILTNNGNVFFSGDSGYFDVFEKVGEKYGPFDLA
ncbi:MAG: MBL fold metallo-hydrolase, partial [Bacteroidales bacterium]|nr:MBL fold metallo-hydrolase [Bacteroidales bacterium]